MSTRNKGIEAVLRHNPHAGPMLEVLSHEGQTSGLGYTVEHVQPGRGFSAREYSKKTLANGHSVYCMTYYPGPLDALAGLSSDIEERYSVFVGWEVYREDDHLFDAPPSLTLPEDAYAWGDQAYDGPRSWFAEFRDAAAAEAYAASLPEYTTDVSPLVREDTVEAVH